MCTVTYLPLGSHDFILTSNRDEDPKRTTIPPQGYEEDGVQLVYPKDALAGGTWIGLSDKKRLICLLNGGFTKHKRAASYKMSRGVIVKQLLKVDDPVAVITDFDFSGIEPFTIVLVDWYEDRKAYELVWDGATKHFQPLGETPKIWSSATLYDEEMKALRKTWFAEWLEAYPTQTPEAILAFHQDETKGNPEISLRMQRSYVETVSITNVQKTEEEVQVTYLDLLQDDTTVLQLDESKGN